MKQWTTPPIVMRVVGGKEALEAAAEVSISLTNNINTCVIPATVQEDGETLVAYLTSEQTAQLKGNLRVEATMVFPDGMVWKTKTAQMKIHESVSGVS